MNNRAILVAGVSGVGKSTLIKAASRNIKHVTSISGSDILRKVIHPLKFGDMASLSKKRKESLRIIAVKHLIAFRDEINGILLVDGHMALQSINGEFECCFTPMDAKLYSDIVVVNAHVEKVLHYRANDKRKRKYISSKPSALREQLSKEIEVAEICAIQYGLKIHIIDGFELADRLKQLEKIIYGNCKCYH